MNKLDFLSTNLFKEEKITNSQAAKILGGGSDTTYTSSTTGWKYGDTKDKDGLIEVNFDDQR